MKDTGQRLLSEHQHTPENGTRFKVGGSPFVPGNALSEGLGVLIGYLIRTRRYRYTRYSDADPEGDVLHLPNDGNCELFDLERDPDENVNVARCPEYESVVRELDRRLMEGILDRNIDRLPD